MLDHLTPPAVLLLLAVTGAVGADAVGGNAMVASEHKHLRRM